MHIFKSNSDKAGNENLSEAAGVNTQLNQAPVFTSQAKASNITRTSMNISAVATDQDTSDTLTYTFYWGTSASNLSLVASNTSGVFPRTDLNMNTTYWFRIDVTDGIDTTPGTANSAATLANSIPSIGTPSVSRVENSTDKLTISVSATDTDDTALTYTLWRGTASSNITKTNITTTGNSGNTVTFIDTGLTMAQTYYYKVSVSDGNGGNSTTINYGNERTYCKGEHCEGVSYRDITCTKCDVNHQISCTTCNGTGLGGNCSGTCISYDRGTVRTDYGWYCRKCGKSHSSDYSQVWTSSRCQSCGKLFVREARFCSANCATTYNFEHNRACSKCNGSGRIVCGDCNGTGICTLIDPCTAHSISGSHYYCTLSTGNHGSNVNEYH